MTNNTKALRMLDSFAVHLKTVPVESFDRSGLEGLVGAARRAQRQLDSLLVRAGVAADRLAAAAGADTDGSGGSAGGSGGAQDLLGGRASGGTSVRSATARRDAERSRLAGEDRSVQAAVAAGSIGGEQLDALARATKDLAPEARERLNMAALVADAERLPPDVFDRRVKAAVRAAQDDHGLADTKARQAASELRHWVDRETGMGCLYARLDPERYETVVTAIEHRMAALANQGGGDTVTKNRNLAATALVDLVTGSGSGGGLPLITVVVDEATMRNGYHPHTTAETGDGHGLAPDSLARLACEAVLRRVVLDGSGVPIDVGRKYRTATDAQWSAAKAVYRCCAWPGCDAPISWCQLHHIHYWRDGGRTDWCNLVPLCNRHHHLAHEGGWSLELSVERALTVTDPTSGRQHTARPDRNPIQRE